MALTAEFKLALLIGTFVALAITSYRVDKYLKAFAKARRGDTSWNTVWKEAISCSAVILLVLAIWWPVIASVVPWR